MDKLNEIKTSELAKFLNVTPPFVSHVKHGRRKLTTDQAQMINKEFGVPLYELRPDVYPKSMFKSVA